MKVRVLGDGDLTVRLRNATGETQLEAATVDFPRKTVPVYFVAAAPAEYTLQIETGATPAAYEIKTEKLHPAGSRDRKRADAERLFAEAAAETARYNFREAAQRYQQASALFRETKELAGMEAGLHHLGLSYNNLDEEDHAIDAYRQAITLARRLKDRRGLGRILGNIGNAYAHLDEPQTALEYYQQAAKLFHSVNDRPRQLAILINLGNSYEKLARYKESTDYHLQGLALSRELGNRSLEGSSLSALGWDEFELGDNDKAIEYDRQALAVERELRDRGSEGSTLHDLGITYHATSRFDDALRCYQDAVAAFREVKNRRGEAAALTNLGRLNDDLGQYDQAVAYFEQTLPILREIKDRQLEAITLTDLAGAYRDLQDDQKSLQADERALSMIREVKDRGFEVITLKELGLTYADLKSPQKAIDYYNQALALERELMTSGNSAEILNNLGAAHLSLRDSAKAVSDHTQALAASRITKDLGEESLALTGLMDAWNQTGRRRLAIFYGKQSINALQALRSSIRSLNRDLQKSFLKKNEKPYHTLAELLIAEGRLGEAEQVLALLKQDEYFEYIRRDSSESGSLDSRADLTPDEADWQKRYGDIGNRLMAIGAERGELVKKKALGSAEQRRLEQLEEELKAGNVAFEKFLGDLTQHFSAKPEINAKVVQQLREEEGLMEDLRELPAGTVAIYTLAGEDKFRAILQTPDAQKAFEYPIQAADLNQKVFEFREALQDPTRDVRPIATELYRILIAPMAEDLRQAKAQTLMWSLDGVLRYLPLAALYDGHRYLIEQYRLSMMTLASSARLKDAPSTDWTLAGFGVTKRHEDAAPLPDVASELAGIEGILNGEVRLDEQFTESSMRATLLKRHPVVHIASHFRFQPGNESKSFLLLGDGTHLSMAELKTLPNLFGGVQLLTLSACNTGLGDGTEVESFGTLAQRQGAKAVVASLWPVADASTSLMMREFYRIRESTPGITKLEALREAQLELLRGKPGSDSNPSRRDGSHSAENQGSLLFKPEAAAPYAHPYYWAPFFLIGNWL